MREFCCMKKKALLKVEASEAVAKAARVKFLTQQAEKKARLAHARRQGKSAKPASSAPDTATRGGRSL